MLSEEECVAAFDRETEDHLCPSPRSVTVVKVCFVCLILPTEHRIVLVHHIFETQLSPDNDIRWSVVLLFFSSQEHEENQSRSSERLTSCVLMVTKRGKGSVGDGETGKKAKTTQHAGGTSVSEKSQTTLTRKILTFFIKMYQSINLVL